MQAVLIVIHLMIVLAIIGLVLLQRSEGGGLGIGGGGGGGLVSIRGQANLLTRITAGLAGAFMITSIVLAIRLYASVQALSTAGVQAGPANRFSALIRAVPTAW